MKHWERLTIYSALVCAIAYGLWAHGKLERLYQINRNRPDRSIPFSPSSQTDIVSTNSPLYMTSLIASRYPNLSIPTSIRCTHYAITVKDATDAVWWYDEWANKASDDWAYRWAVWVDNPNPYWVRGAIFVEFRNSNGSLLKLVGPMPATFPNPSYPREGAGLCSLKQYLAQQIDFNKSRVFVLEEKEYAQKGKK